VSLYKSREEAEEDLLAQLKIVSESENAKRAYKAKRHITNFNDLISSKSCDKYWDVRDIKMAQKRTEKQRAIHDRHIEYNAYQEHDVHSSRITEMTKKRVINEDDTSFTKKVMIQSSSSL